MRCVWSNTPIGMRKEKNSEKGSNTDYTIAYGSWQYLRCRI